jgi:predicted RNA-binding Zn-ribbon protein involved in translation (DUF1610 family)
MITNLNNRMMRVEEHSNQTTYVCEKCGWRGVNRTPVAWCPSCGSDEVVRDAVKLQGCKSLETR